MEESSMEAKRRYDLKAKVPGFQMGDIVCVYNPQKKDDRLTRKLLPRWQEGYKIINKISSVTFQIQKSPRSRIMTVHADRLWLMDRPSECPVKSISWSINSVVMGNRSFFRSRKPNSRRSFPMLTVNTRGPVQSYKNDQVFLLNDKFSAQSKTSKFPSSARVQIPSPPEPVRQVVLRKFEEKEINIPNPASFNPSHVIWAQDRRANKRSAPFPAPYQSTTASSAFTESQDGLPATKIRRTSVFDRLESTIPMVTRPEDSHIARRYFRNRAREGRKERST